MTEEEERENGDHIPVGESGAHVPRANQTLAPPKRKPGSSAVLIIALRIQCHVILDPYCRWGRLRGRPLLRASQPAAEAGPDPRRTLHTCSGPGRAP